MPLTETTEAETTATDEAGLHPLRIFKLAWGLSFPGRRGRYPKGIVKVDPSDRALLIKFGVAKGVVEVTEEWWAEHGVRHELEAARLRDEQARAEALAEDGVEESDLFGPEPGDVKNLSPEDLVAFSGEELKVVLASLGIQPPRRAKHKVLLQIATEAVKGTLRPDEATADPEAASVEDTAPDGASDPADDDDAQDDDDED